MKINTQAWLFEAMIVLSVFVYATSATNQTVGEESGWSLQSDVQTWCSSRTFNVGDTLVFVYKPVHNVLEVNESAYNECNLDDPISITNGNTAIVTLDTIGNRYFICGTQGHCSLGLKVKIVVNAADSDNSTHGRRPKTPPSSSSPPSRRQSPPSPSNATNTPVDTPDFHVPNEVPTAPAGANGCPSSATKIIQHKFIITSAMSLVAIVLMIINY